MKKKALIFYDLDLAIRHFLLSGAFDELEKEYELVHVFHVDDEADKKGIYSDIESLNLKNKVLFNYPRRIAGKWDLLHIPALHHQARGTKQYPPLKDILETTHTPKWRRRFRILSLPGIYQVYRWLFVKLIGVYGPLVELIKKEQPDVLLHPSVFQGFLINDLVLASKRTKIPLLCLMNSWDNPSQKVIVAGHPAKAVVWGEQAKQHALKYMGLPENRIAIGGAAQFEAYRAKLSDMSTLRAEFNVPEDLPVILYAGCSKGVWESDHLATLDRCIENGDLPPCHVIYRPHPWRSMLLEGERSLLDMDLKHVTLDPHMAEYYTQLTQKPVHGFQLSDYSVTFRLMQLADLVISPLSTMILESAFMGNPVMTLYTEDDEAKSKKQVTIGRMRDFVHFDEFFGFEGVIECWDTKDLPSGCRQLLELSHDTQTREHLRTHSNFFVSFTDQTYGKRLRDLTETVIAENTL